MPFGNTHLKKMWNKNKRVRDKAWKIPIISPAGKKTPHFAKRQKRSGH